MHKLWLHLLDLRQSLVAAGGLLRSKLLLELSDAAVRDVGLLATSVSPHLAGITAALVLLAPLGRRLAVQSSTRVVLVEVHDRWYGRCAMLCVVVLLLEVILQILLLSRQARSTAADLCIDSVLLDLLNHLLPIFLVLLPFDDLNLDRVLAVDVLTWERGMAGPRRTERMKRTLAVTE